MKGYIKPLIFAVLGFLAGWVWLKAISPSININNAVTIDIIRRGNIIEIYHHDTHALIFEYYKTKPGDQYAWEYFNDVLIEVTGRQDKGELLDSPKPTNKFNKVIASTAL